MRIRTATAKEKKINVDNKVSNAGAKIRYREIEMSSEIETVADNDIIRILLLNN